MTGGGRPQVVHKASDVRKTFLSFMESKGHRVVPSMPVIPHGDNTLLFTNSGMVQFKEIFQGRVAPGSALDELKAAKRVADTQKCIRAGGKHNDLDDVGKDTYHHTFFEMLGNWSFGEYFKKEAIAWAWELLTDVWKLPKDRLYVTYFGGDTEMNLLPDLEARDFWLALGLSDDHVMPYGKKENFWEMGEVGPCGPCSEIHYDRIGGRDASAMVNADDPEVLEIWNLVFMQYNREADRSLTKLPAPCVDTGMGFERVCSVLNDVHSNYDIDLWFPILDAIQKHTGYAEPYAHGTGSTDADIAYRVIADHIRTLTFALLDGGVPGPQGVGYVLRRVVRRATRFGRQFLNPDLQPGWFASLADSVTEAMGDYFTQLQDQTKMERVKRMLLGEEKLFNTAWESGYQLFKAVVPQAQDGTISGQAAFVLHTRHGFPIDLTQLMAEKEGLKVDEEDYKKHIEQHKTASSSKAAMKAKSVMLGPDHIDELQKSGLPPTDDNNKYKRDPWNAKVAAIFDPETRKFVDTITGSDEGTGIAIILDGTNFYAEGGGQVFDTGRLLLKTSDKDFIVQDAQVNAGYVVHKGVLDNGVTITKGDAIECHVDGDRRELIAANHTMTHVLNHALREVLARQVPDSTEQVDQKGSYVDDKSLRFDFSYSTKLSEDQIKGVEQLINEAIKKDSEVHTLEVDKDEALKIVSLRSMFGEKYPPRVRVVSVGAKIEDLISNPANDEWWKYSVEFCGGTHLPRTGEAQEAVVVSESALGGNTRRITVFTKECSRLSKVLADEQESKLDAVINSTAVPDDKMKSLGVLGKEIDDSLIPLIRKYQLRDKRDKYVALVQKEKKERAGKIKEWGTAIGEKLAQDAADKKQNVIVCVLNELEPQLNGEREAVNEALKVLETKAKDVAALLICIGGDTAMAVGNVPQALTDKLDAREWVKEICNGKGGGKITNAQGAGIPAIEASERAQQALVYATAKLA
jgi:alanyl-tRNA synthetase